MSLVDTKGDVRFGSGSADGLRVEGEVPVYWGDPRLLTNEQLESMRFSHRAHNFGGLNTRGVRSATISTFNEMHHRSQGNDSLSHREPWSRMRQPLIFKYPDDIPNDSMLDTIVHGFWEGMQTMDAHTKGSVRSWERNQFNPQYNMWRVVPKDTNLPVVYGQNIWNHEAAHAKSHLKETNSPGYICVSLYMNPRKDNYPEIRLHRAFLRPTQRVSAETILKPNFPSDSDWNHAFWDQEKCMSILQSKPWWHLLHDAVQHKIRTTAMPLDTLVAHLTNAENELFFTDKTNHTIDRAKIAKIDTPMSSH